jgi:hypothetical protein
MVILYAIIVSSCWIIGSRNCLSKAVFQKRSMNIYAFIQKNHGRYNFLKSVECVEEKLTSLDCADVILEEAIENGISLK